MKSNNFVIKALYINNFKAYKPDNNFSSSFKKIDFFDVNNNSVDLMVLSGFNGYGKTSIFQAIEFVFSGKIDLFDYKDKNKKFEENIIINNLNRESFIAIELMEGASKKIKTLVRYVKRGKAGKGNEYSKEAKDYKAYILEDEFNYSKFIELEKKGEIQAITKEDIAELVGEKSIDEWINENYIRQENNSNVLFKTDTDRVNFINKFIDQAYNQQFDEFVEEEKKIDEKIKSINEEITEIHKQINLNQVESIGEEPPNEVLLLEENAAWDKNKYNENEDFENYIEKVKNINSFFKNLNKYTAKYKIDLINDILDNEELIKGAIISTYSEKIRKEYIDNYNMCDYLIKFVSNKKSFLENQIQEKYLHKDWKNRIEIIRKSKKELDKQSDKKVELYEKVKDLRQEIGNNSDLFTSVFDNVCPLCGHDYSKDDVRLKESIEQYNELFKECNKVLDSTLANLSKNIDEQYSLMKKEMELFVESIEYSKDIKLLVDKVNKNLTKYVSCDNKIKFIIKEFNKNNFEFNENIEESKFNKKYSEIIREIQQVKQICEELIRDFITTDYNEIIYIESKSYCIKLNSFNYSEFKNKIDAKLEHLNWNMSKKQMNLLSKNKALLKSKINDYRVELIKKKKVSKVLNKVLEAKKAYLNEIVKYIEIPLYIYSGKLIQTHQNGLGIFCFTGPDEDKLTQFKLTIDGKSTGHDIVNKFSAGQKAIINVSLMLAFRKVINSKLDIFMIDDPCQSMDDINIASLTEILKNEFNKTQLIISTHNDEIAGYMIYRFKKIGKSARNFNVQKELYSIAMEN